MDHMDQTGLLCASLVCRAWNHQSVRLLYCAIEIRQRAAFDILSRKSSAARTRLATTKELRITQCEGAPFCHVLPLTLGPVMPAVERLALYACLQPLMHPTFVRYLPSFASVKELEMSAFKFSSAGELRRVLRAFPQLTELSLARGEIVQDTRSPDEGQISTTYTVGPRSMRIQTLVLGVQLSAPALSALIDFLVTSSACQSTTRLEF